MLFYFFNGILNAADLVFYYHIFAEQLAEAANFIIKIFVGLTTNRKSDPNYRGKCNKCLCPGELSSTYIIQIHIY